MGDDPGPFRVIRVVLTARRSFPVYPISRHFQCPSACLKGQTEKNSVRAYVFRFAPELGHCSTQSACLQRANFRTSAPDETLRLRILCPNSAFMVKRSGKRRRTSCRSACKRSNRRQPTQTPRRKMVQPSRPIPVPVAAAAWLIIETNAVRLPFPESRH